MRLLEIYGLSRIDTQNHLHSTLNTADWRIAPEDTSKRAKKEDSYSETSSEAREREMYVNGECEL